jgi:hypothetical protein
MSNTERDLARFNDGKMASLILSNLSPILESIKTEAQARFLNEFKDGKLDATKSLAYAAELRILEEIENKLKSKINTADRTIVERQHDDISRDSQEFS